MTKRMVDTNLWNDEDIIEAFTAEDKYFWLYLLTNPHNNICGVLKNSPALMARDMGLHKDTIKNLVYRFENVHKLIVCDQETSEILILNWSKYNWTKSPKLFSVIEKEISSIKSEKLKDILTKKAESLIEKDTVSIPYRYPTNTNTNISNIDNIGTNTYTNTKTISIDNIYKYVKECYGKYGYGSRLNKKETCKRLMGILNSKDKRKHLYPLQVMLAYACYLKEKSATETESQYIKHSAEFLTNMVYDYAEKIAPFFEQDMVDKYGEDWREIEFKVVG